MMSYLWCGLRYPLSLPNLPVLLLHLGMENFSVHGAFKDATWCLTAQMLPGLYHGCAHGFEFKDKIYFDSLYCSITLWDLVLQVSKPDAKLRLVHC